MSHRYESIYLNEFEYPEKPANHDAQRVGLPKGLPKSNTEFTSKELASEKKIRSSEVRDRISIPGELSKTI